MDPITIGATVLAAIGAEVKSKASGAAAKWLTEAAKEHAARLMAVAPLFFGMSNIVTVFLLALESKFEPSSCLSHVGTEGNV